MSKSLSSVKEHDRVQLAQWRLAKCNKGKDKQGYGISGLGYWAAFDYLNSKRLLTNK